MKKKYITLKQFVESCPCYLEKVYGNDIPENFNNLSYTEKYGYLGSCSSQKLIITKSKDQKNLYILIDIVTPKRVGKNIFLSHEKVFLVNIIDGKISKSIINLNTLIEVLSLLDLTTSYLSNISDLNKGYLPIRDLITKNKIILRKILTGRIYNEETLYKALASSVYKCRSISWKNLRGIIKYNATSYPSFSVSDIISFTTNPNLSIEAILNKTAPSHLLHDTLECATQLGTLVNFSWSEKRLNEEHKNQINLLRKEEISKKEKTPIFEADTLSTDTIKLLNNELDIFLEGTNMHHCLYNCYYDRIKNKEYIAFHMTAPEDCTFGVRLSKDKKTPFLDQIYLAYDKMVSKETSDIAKAFIESNKEVLLDLLKSNTKSPYWELELM